MKLKFKDQQFQIDATAAVCDVFEGQPYHDPTVYTVDPGRKAPKPVFGSTVRQANLDLGIEPVRLEQMELGVEDDPPDVGYANAEIKIAPEVMLANLNGVKDRQRLERSSLCVSASPREHELRPALPELEVEMETGTGKTFVYTKTIFELNKRYGWSKFIIIVPGVAIREGVKKSIDITAEKFFADYGKTAKTFIYNSSHPQDILDFSTNPDIQIIVMNVQAFNARGADARRIFMALDEFGSRKPIDLIAANRPILILDEPQKMEGSATQEMLPKFNPLFILRYSATHRTLRNLVYKLDAIDAFDQKIPGKALGNVSEARLRRIQIREAIRARDGVAVTVARRMWTPTTSFSRTRNGFSRLTRKCGSSSPIRRFARDGTIRTCS